MNSDYKLSRRSALGAISASVASIAVSKALAENQHNEIAATAEPLVTPLTRFPKPPFESQSQPWPGLAGKMNPRPDHGEKSYKGSGRLLGRKALIS